MQIYKNLSLENIPGEIWKDIKNYEGLYQVSNLGRIKSLERLSKRKDGRYNKEKTRILKQCDDNYGYLQVKLTKNNKEKSFKVHQLVIKAFKDNVDNKPTVDHINGNKYDNRIENLKWSTYKEQAANEVTSKKYKKAMEENRKKVMCIQTGQIFNSALEANNYYNLNKNLVCNAANPNNKRRYAGFILDNSGNKIKLEWKYID